MYAMMCKAYGPPESLTLDELASPKPGPGEVAIAVKACGVNFPDALMIQGKYQFKPPMPFAPGGEVAGVVMDTGEGVISPKVGDRVAASIRWGGFAEEALADAARCVAIPDGTDYAVAATFILAYGTSYHALKDRACLKAGETLVVLGAAGGVGALAVSHNDGTSWQLRPLPQKYCTYSLGPGLTITTTGVLYVVCTMGVAAGSEPKDLYTSGNGAIGWQHEATLETYGYADGIIAASPSILWRYGARAAIFGSTDAGKTWHAELDDKVGDTAGPSTQGFAASGTTALAFAYGLPPGPPSPTFAGPWTINEYRTTDAGASWQTRPLQP